MPCRPRTGAKLVREAELATALLADFVRSEPPIPGLRLFLTLNAPCPSGPTRGLCSSTWTNWTFSSGCTCLVPMHASGANGTRGWLVVFGSAVCLRIYVVSSSQVPRDAEARRRRVCLNSYRARCCGGPWWCGSRVQRGIRSSMYVCETVSPLRLPAHAPVHAGRLTGLHAIRKPALPSAAALG